MKSFYDYCVEQNDQELLSSWDMEKNAPLTQHDVSYGSSTKKIWWRCGSGHSWQSTPYVRTCGSGCPYCSGRKVKPGETDLASTHPELAKEWHPTKNAPLTPQQVSAGSHRRVWWVCGHGHEWQAIVKSRAEGAGCPVCANRVVVPGENDLGTTHPELALEWDAEKNLPLTPEALTEGSKKKVWWTCSRGHSWQASPASRTRGAGCPVCAGKVVVRQENDLGSRFPDIAREWHPNKNRGISPQGIAPSSNRKVWWVCPLGHEYMAAVGSRTVNGTGCPYCSGKKVFKGFNDLETLEPKIAKEWHPTLNGTLTPDQVTVGSRRKVWWQCSLGHVWKAVIYSRTGERRCGCPACAGKVNTVRQARYRIMEREQIERAGRQA